MIGKSAFRFAFAPAFVMAIGASFAAIGSTTPTKSVGLAPTTAALNPDATVELGSAEQSAATPSTSATSTATAPLESTGLKAILIEETAPSPTKVSRSISVSEIGATAEAISVETPRGIALSGFIHRPATAAQKTPVVILAPGRGYHMSRPLISGLADHLARQGITAIRFDWAYQTANTQPSEDLKAENEDLRAVVAYARKDERLDSEKIILAGKSLGSMIAYKVFQSDSLLFALHLLTPVCDSDEEVKNIYPDLAKSTRPVALLLGNEDPVCPIGVLYKNLAGASSAVTTTIVGGNHSLTFGEDPLDAATAERNAANLEQARASITHWVKLHLGR